MKSEKELERKDCGGKRREEKERKICGMDLVKGLVCDEYFYKKYGNLSTMIGKGGHADVYRLSRHPSKAVKVYNRSDDFIKSGARRERLNLVLMSECPYVITMFESYNKNGINAIVMEVGVCNLRELLYLNVVPIKLEHIEQVINSIIHCHSIELIHGDIKPDNFIYFPGEDRLKLCDFTCSHTKNQYEDERLTTSNSTSYSLWYRHPEIMLNNNCQRSYAYDMWALGCVIYEMVTRTILFNKNDINHMLYEIFYRLGTPTDTTWPGFSSLTRGSLFPIWPGVGFFMDIEFFSQNQKIKNLLSSLLPQIITYNTSSASKISISAFFE